MIVEFCQSLPNVGAGNVAAAFEIRVLEFPQGVDDDGVHIQIEDPVQGFRQQQRGCQPVVDLAGVALAFGETVEFLGIYGNKVDPEAAGGLGTDGSPIRLPQVRVEDIGVILRLPALAGDGA